MKSPARDRARRAMAATSREGFLPPDQVRWADADRPLPIGEGQTNSQPTTVLDMLELLAPVQGDRVLDVGSGSGWTTGILAELVGRAGTVLGVERRPRLVDFGSRRVRALNRPWATIRAAQDGVLGAPDCAPFDRILVSAQGTELPQSLIDQLGDEGVLVAPVAGRLVRVSATAGGAHIERFGRYNFVPLVP
ncbi:protein-L-isoaspartate O-methyltransferase family protein [Leekyejoonella antrihumi]|uniref:Protein-L-isoaspartate O-methyltransferase n=1 Tax=Leekyejoonella antrihumi TaxID=1660198 RepID=A0A563E4Z8_9MICO|nr:protein-L-isoaspartate carboxylmethyltransferase [Leekyejoonella antrihumi]TWP37610.1 protein-L-isoaspartate carboxylmethyltransferase [Leekyejoonella antrihumi]